MEVVMAFVIGGLYAAGIYMITRRSISKVILGLVLLSHAANLLIFTAGGLTRAVAPLILEDPGLSEGRYADPLPQALILTAIVISFGVLAFTVVLFHRAYQDLGTDDLDDLRATDT